jgi:hypothetical protein
MEKKNLKNRSVTIVTLLLLFLILFTFFTGCDYPWESQADRLVNAIEQLPKESAAWRMWATEAEKDLPPNIRNEIDIAVNRATMAANDNFQCGVDFLRERLHEDLLGIVAEMKNQTVPEKQAIICKIAPLDVITLDENYKPNNSQYITFDGYNLDNKRAQLESTDGSIQDISQCCVDNPTHYRMTVKFNRISFDQKSERIKIPGTVGNNSVGIITPALAQPEYYKEITGSGSCEDICSSNGRVAIYHGIHPTTKESLYYCSFDSQGEGVRPGFNYDSKCFVENGKTRTATLFNCPCLLPNTRFDITGSTDPTCDQSCKKRGGFALSPGISKDDENPFYYCSLTRDKVDVAKDIQPGYNHISKCISTWIIPFYHIKVTRDTFYCPCYYPN